MKRRMTLESAEQEEEAIRLGFSGKSADSECSQDRGSCETGCKTELCAEWRRIRRDGHVLSVFGKCEHISEPPDSVKYSLQGR